MAERELTTPNTGITLRYETWGGPPPSPRPSMVLVHGLASTMKIWSRTGPLLAEKYDVVAYDQRGHAGSDKPEDGYDLQTMLSDLEGLVAELDLRRPIIVGHSWGATIALAYAVNCPNNCGGIALVDGGVSDLKGRPGATWESVSEHLAPPDLSRFTLDDLLAWARGGPFKNLSESFLREYFGSMMEVQLDGTIRARLTRPHHMQILRAIWDASPHQMLPRVNVPALAVLAHPADASEDDPFLESKKRGVENLHEVQARTKLVWMRDTIHDIPLQRPRRLANEILKFFADEGAL